MKKFLFLFHLLSHAVIAMAQPQLVEVFVCGQSFVFHKDCFQGLEESSLYRALFSKRIHSEAMNHEGLDLKCLDGMQGVYPETFATVYHAIEKNQHVLKDIKFSISGLPDDVVSHISAFDPGVAWKLLESDLKDLGLFGSLQTSCGWSSLRCDEEGRFSHKVLRFSDVDFSFTALHGTNLVCMDRLLTRKQCAAVFKVTSSNIDAHTPLLNISALSADFVIKKINEECQRKVSPLRFHLPTQEEWRKIVKSCHGTYRNRDFCLFDEFSLWTKTTYYRNGRVVCGAKWIDLMDPGVTRVGDASACYSDVGIRLITHF